MKPFIIVGALAVLLGGCGTAHQTTEVAPAKTVTVTPTEIGPICAADVQDIPFVRPGYGLLGLLGPRASEKNREIALENTRRRQEARAHQPSYCPPDTPRAHQATAEVRQQSIDGQQRQAEALEQMQQDLWLQNQQLQSQLQAKQTQDFVMQSQQNFWNMVGAMNSLPR